MFRHVPNCNMNCNMSSVEFGHPPQERAAHMHTVSQNGKLVSMIWSDAEMEGISWHDSHVRSLLLGANSGQLLLDIDFICEWIEAREQHGIFSFYITPATLVFPYVQEIKVSLSTVAPMSIFSIEKENPTPTPQGNTSIWEWVIDGPHGQIRLQATGYALYFRREPVLTHSQFLTLSERGGIAFDIPGGYEE